MAEWVVTVPIYGCATVFVDAESEEEAIAQAKAGEWHESEIDEWEVSGPCRGSGVCYRTSHDRFRATKNE